MRRFLIIRYSRAAYRSLVGAGQPVHGLTGAKEVVKSCRNQIEAADDMLIELLKEKVDPDSALAIITVC